MLQSQFHKLSHDQNLKKFFGEFFDQFPCQFLVHFADNFLANFLAQVGPVVGPEIGPGMAAFWAGLPALRYFSFCPVLNSVHPVTPFNNLASVWPAIGVPLSGHWLTSLASGI